VEVSQSIVLGIVQGLSEFLPISSSGHLVLANYFLGWGESLPPVVTFATNTGTFLAVLAYLWRDVVTALRGFAAGLLSAEGRASEGWRMALLVIIGSVPTLLIGLFLRESFDRLNAPLPVAFALIATGLILWTAPRGGAKRSVFDLSVRDALVIGFVQGLAIIPGISRSGSTIAALLWRGASSDLAPRVSFMLYLVASLGVTLITIDELLANPIAWDALIWMTLASGVIGYASLFVLFALLRRGRFRVFSPYLWLLAAATLARLILVGADG
jgi:undecaprenyl-diphosphatase